jgi:single-stranded-DNA-specific exonuclease
MEIIETILARRGYNTQSARDAFLSPDYGMAHDPFLLPDMDLAVDRLILALKKQEKIMIYGDYDIDGLTATTVLLDAFESFGFKNVNAFIPNRFVEGYGMTVEAVEKIAESDTTLIVTVDCGSLSEKEIVRAKELGMGVIVTDHHNVAPKQPPAVAVINPKRLLQDYPGDYKNLMLIPDSKQKGKIYPFLDLPGVGVAFKLVQALQTRLDGLPIGQEKWLLDLVALGTVCDVVNLVDENRIHVHWGLKVLAKTRRYGLKALMAVSGVEPESVNARSLGFALGPRMNAAGRLVTAQIALDMLTADDPQVALAKAMKLDEMNKTRRAEQDVIFQQAIEQAERQAKDSVLVVSQKGWNHGIVGIVAAKLLEKYKKPTYVLSENGDETKGSARSFGDFSVADAIRASDDVITKGGGHKLAAGVTLPTENIVKFRERVNMFYRELQLESQAEKLLAVADVEISFDKITKKLVDDISRLEPFGNMNPQPVMKTSSVLVQAIRTMGANNQHVKLSAVDNNITLQLIAFNAPEHFLVEPGTSVDIWYELIENEWRGNTSIEGRLLRVDGVEKY